MPRETSPAELLHDAAAAIAPPPARTFRLPSVAVTRPVAAANTRTKEEPAKHPRTAPLLVPKDWLLRGSAPQNYDLKSDRNEVLSGQASVQLVSHEKDIAPTEFASLMQTISAAPWVGKHVEFSVSTRSREMRRDMEVWVRVTDADDAVIEYRQWQTLYGKPEWKTTSIIVDVPWSAAQIAYGVSLRGVGTLWIDNAQLKALDRSIAVSGTSYPDRLGVIVQVADEGGPLAQPSNMDFEEVVPADERFRQVPEDELGRARF